MSRRLRLPEALRGLFPRFMPIWLRRTSFPINISSMQAVSRAPISSRRNLTTELTRDRPTLKSHWYQAETGYDLTHFDIDWEAETVTCPQGRSSSSWTSVQDAGKSLIKVKFSQSDCQVCPARASCTGTTRRTLTLHPREQMHALFAARKREETNEFKDTYRHRAGIEGTHSQGVRTMGLRRSRYIGLRKTHLGHVVIATAVNVIQLMSWLRGEAPEQTRSSAFKRVMEQAA